MSLIQLNEECLEHIFKMLNLEDQFSIRRLNLPQFNPVIKSIWRRSIKAIQMPADKKWHKNVNYYHCLREIRYFSYFVSVVGPRLQTVQLSHSTQLAALARSVLPNVVELSACLTEDLRRSINLGEVFPALERLVLKAGERNIRVELDLDKICRCHKWMLIYALSKLNESVKLQELSLDEVLLHSVIDCVATQMPSLRLISATRYVDRAPLLKKIAKLWPLAQQVHTIGYKFERLSELQNFSAVEFDAIGRFKSVRKIYFYGRSDAITIFDFDFEEILTTLPLLREIHYGYDYDYLNEKFDSEFVYDFIKLIKDALLENPRAEPLELHCYVPDLEYVRNYNSNVSNMILLTFHDDRIEPFPLEEDVSIFCDAREIKAE